MRILFKRSYVNYVASVDSAQDIQPGDIQMNERKFYRGEEKLSSIGEEYVHKVCFVQFILFFCMNNNEYMKLK